MKMNNSPHSFPLIDVNNLYNFLLTCSTGYTYQIYKTKEWFDGHCGRLYYLVMLHLQHFETNFICIST